MADKPTLPTTATGQLSKKQKTSHFSDRSIDSANVIRAVSESISARYKVLKEKESDTKERTRVLEVQSRELKRLKQMRDHIIQYEKEKDQLDSQVSVLKKSIAETQKEIDLLGEKQSSILAEVESEAKAVDDLVSQLKPLEKELASLSKSADKNFKSTERITKEIIAAEEEAKKLFEMEKQCEEKLAQAKAKVEEQLTVLNLEWDHCVQMAKNLGED